MKRYLILLVYIIGIYPLFAQEGGICFQDITLEEACKQAAKEGKKVFIDCFTKTCGPCKYMMKNIFPLKECGDYFNPRFISLAKDVDEGDGPDIRKKYDVGIYPTFLIVNPDGSLFCKEIGAVTLKSQTTFVQKMERAIQTAEMGEQYRAGKRDIDFITAYIDQLKASGSERLSTVLNETLAPLSVKELCTDAYWNIIQADVNSTESAAFRKLLEHRKEFIAALGREKVENKIMSTYQNEFSMNKMMGMDFEKRIADLKILEQENYKGALALRYCQTVRNIIDHKKTGQAGEVVEILQELPTRLSDAGERLSVVKELTRFERVANASQQEKAVKALQALKSACQSEKESNEINRAIAKLSPNH